MMAEHRIGDVLYVVLNKENRVYPVQVVEVITKQTMTSDKSVSYIVKGGKSDDATMPLEKMDGEVFSSPDAVRKALTERATSVISKMVATAASKAIEWYGDPIERAATVTSPVQSRPATRSVPVDVSDDELSAGADTFIELPNGGKARVKSVSVPDVLK